MIGRMAGVNECNRDVALIESHLSGREPRITENADSHDIQIYEQKPKQQSLTALCRFACSAALHGKRPPPAEQPNRSCYGGRSENQY